MLSVQYRTDIHRNKCQALTVARLTHSPYTTNIARIRCYPMASTIECQGCTTYDRCVGGVFLGEKGGRRGVKVREEAMQTSPGDL